MLYKRTKCNWVCLGPFSLVSLPAWVITFIVVLFGYKSRIFHSYGFHSSGAYGNGLFSAKLHASIGKSNQDLTATTVAEWRYILNEATKEQWGTTHVRLLQKASDIRGSTFSELKIAAIRYSLAMNLYSRSLLPVMPSLAFMLIYGFT